MVRKYAAALCLFFLLLLGGETMATASPRAIRWK